MKTFKPGDVIVVKIDGRDYETIIDRRYIQRFRENRVVKKLAVNLNNLTCGFHSGEFSQRDYMEYLMQRGYSVSGLCDHEFMNTVEVINPLWEDD